MRDKVRKVVGYHHVAARWNHGVGRECKLYPAADLPSSQRNHIRSPIEQFQVLIGAAKKRLNHDLIEHHIGHKDRTIARPRCAAGQRIKTRGSIGHAAKRDPECAALERQRINHPRGVRIGEINRFSARPQRKAQFGGVERKKSVRRKEGARRHPIFRQRRCRVAQVSAREVDDSFAVVVKLDKIRRIGGAGCKNLVDHDRVQRVRSGRFSPAR